MSADSTDTGVEAGVATETDVDVETEETDEGTSTDVDTEHLEDVPDGCGCAEVWEHTSGHRED